MKKIFTKKEIKTKQMGEVWIACLKEEGLSAIGATEEEAIQYIICMMMANKVPYFD